MRPHKLDPPSISTRKICWQIMQVASVAPMFHQPQQEASHRDGYWWGVLCWMGTGIIAHLIFQQHSVFQ